MSRIEELIKEKCSSGVEYRPLKDLCTIITKQTGFDYSSTIKPALLTEASTETYSFIQNKDFEGNNINLNTDYYVPISIAEKYPKITLDTPSLLISLSGKVGNVGFYNLKTKAFIGGAVGICKLNESVNGKFVMYYLMSAEGQKYLFKSIKAASHVNLTVESIRETPIPMPPMEVQKEIVRILDKFTELQAELQVELDIRKKQYEYYREALLDFGDNVEYRPLGDSCYIKARIGWQKLNKSEYLSEGNYYLVTGVNITKTNRVNFADCYFVSKERYDMDVNIQLQNGDIIITKDGTIGKVALIEEMDKPAVLNSHLFVIRDITGKLNHKFLLYVFLSDYFTRFVMGNKTSGTIAGLNQATMVKFNIPFPTVDEQERVVGILDKFVQLIESLTNEIAARHKQYEYYRDKLLTFKRKVV